MVGGEQLKVEQERHIPQIHDNEIFHPVPFSQQKQEFAWRIKVDVRSAVDMPLNRVTTNGLPTCFVGIRI